MIYLTLFWTFFKIGLFTFGGGYAMLPLIQQYVLGFNWLSEEELVNFVAVSESTPGPFAINIATYVGSSQAGVLGALCTTLGVVLPSFVIILIVAKCYMAFKESLVVRGMMNGLKPVVVGLIGSAVISFAAAVFFPCGIYVLKFHNPEILGFRRTFCRRSHHGAQKDSPHNHYHNFGRRGNCRGLCGAAVIAVRIFKIISHKPTDSDSCPFKHAADGGAVNILLLCDLRNGFAVEIIQLNKLSLALGKLMRNYFSQPCQRLFFCPSSSADISKKAR